MTASRATKQGALHPAFKVDILCGEILIQCGVVDTLVRRTRHPIELATEASPSGSEVLLLFPKVGDHN